MNESDKEEFASYMNGICIVYGKESSPELYKIYFDSFRESSLIDFKNAVDSHMKDTRSGQFFPKPADIIKHMNSGKSSVEIKNNQAAKTWINKKMNELKTGIPAYTATEIKRLESQIE